MTLSAWLVEGALVWERVDAWKPWVKYRVRRVKAVRACRSGYSITLQKLEPPFFKWGREVDASFCREAFEDDPVPDVSWDGTRPLKSLDPTALSAGRASGNRCRRAGVQNCRVRVVPDLPRKEGST